MTTINDKMRLECEELRGRVADLNKIIDHFEWRACVAIEAAEAIERAHDVSKRATEMWMREAEKAERRIAELEENRASIERFVADKEAGRITATMAGDIVKIFVCSWVEYFRDAGCENFLTFDAEHDDFGRFSVVMQKAGGKTPTEKLSELAAENKRLKKLLEDVGQCLEN